ncbi:MAG: hypothetical protein A2V70_17300 [Planctomycetes bacterium RBG_13_63_9]|nr:MAG: hypothetical protein A2V70_17300 [Planctomycetes bacterium RBG_13_63_9]
MKTLSIQLAAVTVTLALQSGAEAQAPQNVAHVQPLHSVQSNYSLGLRPGYYAPAPYGLWYHHASTAAAAYQRGVAARIYAQGAYNRMTAEARVIHAEGRRREIENREMAAETYFAMRAANEEARAAQRRPRATEAELARFAEQAKPDRLSPSELSATTGAVSWPVLLQSDEFAELRAELESVFSTRAANGEIGADELAVVSQTTSAMLNQLRKTVRDVNPMDYVMARRFIESLAYEARSPAS